jgi:hypothetical protein
MLRKAFLFVCIIGQAVLVPGCAAPELPTSPSSLTAGVIVYEHANFGGNSAHVTGDIPDLRAFSGPCVHEDGDGGVDRDWNDCVSSIRVAPGWRATIYKDTGYRDDALEATTDVPNLQLVSGDCEHDGLNDCVSSIRVRQQ